MYAVSPFVLFIFRFLGGAVFSEYFVPLPLPFPPCVLRLRRTFFLPDGVFLPRNHRVGWIFYIIISLYQSINQTTSELRGLTLVHYISLLIVCSWLQPPKPSQPKSNKHFLEIKNGEEKQKSIIYYILL